MKTGIFVAAALAQLAIAQPHRQHKHLHEKKDVVTHVEYVTAHGPDVVVYVDSNGKPVSTVTKGQAAATIAPAAVYTAPAPAAYVPSVKPVPNKPSPTQAAPAAYTSKTSAGSSELGIVYSPYNADSSCKSLSQVSTDFEKITGYGFVRIYGTDCDQLNTVGSAAKAKGMKLFAGIYDIANVASEAQAIADYCKDDFSFIPTISVGNELVNSGQASVDAVVAAIGTARGVLKAAGYPGNIVTVDTFNALIANPALCHASDFAAANAHAFYDPNVLAAASGPWAIATAAAVKAACGKDVVITESGWPSAGNANGIAIPSLANQQAAISSLKSAFPNGGIVLFSAYDDDWKVNTGATFGAETSYGIYGKAPSSY